MNHALPSESYIARLDYLAFNGKECSSVAYGDEQRFLDDLKESQSSHSKRKDSGVSR